MKLVQIEWENVGYMLATVLLLFRVFGVHMKIVYSTAR